jgi:hypothetical protein
VVNGEGKGPDMLLGQVTFEKRNASESPCIHVEKS